MKGIQVVGAVKHFASGRVLDQLDLEVSEGSVTAILGASGSGKTTLLRLIAGFERLDAGQIRLGVQTVDDGQHSVQAQHRGVGFVPQDAGLFPHLTVTGNVGFGLPQADRPRVSELIDLVGLTGLEKRRPHELSGGQQQRVALARALAVQPKVLLLDEPFAALDASLRSTVRQDVSRIVADSGTTTILVTHDQDEALSLADQVAVLDGGVLRGYGTPRELYNRPEDDAVAARLGEANLLAARIEEGRALTVLGPIDLDQTQAGYGTGVVVVRPEQLVLHEGLAPETVAARVDRVEFYGHDAVTRLTLADRDSTPITARMPGSRLLAAGQPVWVSVTGTAHIVRSTASAAGTLPAPSGSLPSPT